MTNNTFSSNTVQTTRALDFPPGTCELGMLLSMLAENEKKQPAKRGFKLVPSIANGNAQRYIRSKRGPDDIETMNTVS